MPVKLSMLLCCLLALSSCGESGTWDDDPQNWTRAFGQPPSSDVKVSHSRYWLSSHFTHESEYFFELSAPDSFIEAWISGQKLKTRTPVRELQPPYFSKPVWFTPKSLSDYEMWMPSDEPLSKFRIFRDRASKLIYVTDCST
jgi:hypothetical protein